MASWESEDEVNARYLRKLIDDEEEDRRIPRTYDEFEIEFESIPNPPLSAENEQKLRGRGRGKRIECVQSNITKKDTSIVNVIPIPAPMEGESKITKEKCEIKPSREHVRTPLGHGRGRRFVREEVPKTATPSSKEGDSVQIVADSTPTFPERKPDTDDDDEDDDDLHDISESIYENWDPYKEVTESNLNYLHDLKEGEPEIAALLGARITGPTVCRFNVGGRCWKGKHCVMYHPVGSDAPTASVRAAEILSFGALPKKDEIQPKTFKLGKICHVNSPHDFYIRPNNGTQCCCKLGFDEDRSSNLKWMELDTLTAKMNRHLNAKHIAYQTDVYEKHQLVACLIGTGVKATKKWYRGVVLKKAEVSATSNTTSVDVQLIDVGSKVIVHFTECTQLPKGFATLPPMAYRCALSDLIPVGNEFCSMESKYFRSLVLDKELLIEVRFCLNKDEQKSSSYFEEPPYHVDIYFVGHDEPSIGERQVADSSDSDTGILPSSKNQENIENSPGGDGISDSRNLNEKNSYNNFAAGSLTSSPSTPSKTSASVNCVGFASTCDDDWGDSDSDDGFDYSAKSFRKWCEEHERRVVQNLEAENVKLNWDYMVKFALVDDYVGGFKLQYCEDHPDAYGDIFHLWLYQARNHVMNGNIDSKVIDRPDSSAPGVLERIAAQVESQKLKYLAKVMTRELKNTVSDLRGEDQVSEVRDAENDADTKRDTPGCKKALELNGQKKDILCSLPMPLITHGFCAYKKKRMGVEQNTTSGELRETVAERMARKGYGVLENRLACLTLDGPNLPDFSFALNRAISICLGDSTQPKLKK